MGRVWVTTVVCVGIALAGCGTPTPPVSQPPAQAATTTTTAVGPSATTSAAVAPATVPEQLRFTAKTVDGTDFSGPSLAGKPTVLWFWAPWCPKCRGEAPGVADAIKSAGGSVTFVGVAARDEVPNMRSFIDQYSLGGIVHLADTDLAVWKRFGVVEQPAYAFITAAGTVEVVTARVSRDELTRRVQALQ